ncbi:MAG: hypothetical protein JXD21_07495 [Candidatus Omnitrophica bacterium]|nr:hypothetical protein [Candidatus Omnitrophota bacterium]
MENFHRIYYGAEFCEYLLPRWEEIEKALDFCNEQKKTFSFLTPIVSAYGIDVLIPIFKRLNTYSTTHNRKVEVIVNDLGILSLLKEYSSLGKVIGRLLSKQRTDPRIVRYQDDFTESQLDTLSHSQFSKSFCAALKEYNIIRIELDNPFQGIADSFIQNGLGVSLYYPLVSIATTRLCLFNINETYHLPEIKECKKKSCKALGTFRLTHSTLPVPILLQGNAQLYENKSLPPELEKKGIDRLIHNIGIVT